MSDANVPMFKCGSCGRKFAWKQELAGKKLKCKCGQIFRVPEKVGAAKAPSSPSPDKPAAPAAANPAPPPKKEPEKKKVQRGTDDLEFEDDVDEMELADEGSHTGGTKCPKCGKSLAATAVICVQCGYNLKTGQQARTGVGDEAEFADNTTKKGLFGFLKKKK